MLFIALLMTAGCGKKLGSIPLSSVAPDTAMVAMTPAVIEVGGTQVSAKLSVTSGQQSAQGTHIDANFSVQ
ncbi:MAG: hypothetical protein ACXWQE_03010 [Bdellovibrionales bacterium]